MGLKQERPKITKSNVVCAEPMPGEKEMLDEFLKSCDKSVMVSRYVGRDEER